MPTATLPKLEAKPRLKRRRTVRALGTALVLLAAAYASLPAWMPADLLARRIVRQLSADLQRPVSIGRMRVGWIDGVVIEDVRIGDLPGSPNPHLVRIERVHAGLTPLTTLATGRVDILELCRPEVWLVRGADGRLNIERLPQQKHPRLPSLNYRLEGLTCHVWTPDARQSFRIDAAQCRLEPDTALLDMNGWAMVPRPGGQASWPSSEPGERPSPAGASRLGFDARLTVPKLRPELDLSLNGAIRVEWSHLAMADLPLLLLPKLPAEQVGGTSSGSLAFDTRPDLTVDFRGQVAVEGVRLMWTQHAGRPPKSQRPAVIPDAVLQCEGHWDPNTDSLTVRQVDCETGAVHVRGASGRALHIDPRGTTSFEAKIAGEVKDWKVLRQEAPQIDTLAGPLGIDAAGRADFSAEVSRRGNEGRLAIQLDGKGSRWTVAGKGNGDRLFDAGEGTSKRLEVAATLDLASLRARPSLRLEASGLVVTGAGDLIAPASLLAGLSPGGQASCPPSDEPRGKWPGDALKGLAAELAVSSEHVEDFIRLFPAARNSPRLAAWQGPLRMQMNLSPGASNWRVDTKLTAGEAAVIGWGDWFEKPEGDSLVLSCGLTVPQAAEGTIDDLQLAMAHRGATARMEGGQIQYRLWGVTAVLPLHISQVEAVAGLCPRWRAMVTEVGRECSGPLDITTRADLSRVPGDELVRIGAEINATDVAVRWGDSLDKRAGDPLTVRLAGRRQVTGGTREEWLTAFVEGPGANFEVQYGRDEFSNARPGNGQAPQAASPLAHVAQSGMGQPNGVFEQAMLDVQVADIEDLLKLSPALVERLKPYAPAGAVRVQAGSVLADGRRSADISVNATGAGFEVPGKHALAKPVGMDAEAAFRWEMEPAGVDSGPTWKLAAGQARLGGVNLAELAGRAELEPGQESDPAALLVASRSGKGMPRVVAAHVSCRGTARCGEELERLHPLAADLRERFGLNGTFGWQMEVAGNSEALRWHGRLEAKELSWQVRTAGQAVPVLHKPLHMPANVVIDVAASPGLAGGPEGERRRLDAHVDMEIDGNRMRADGNVWTVGLFSRAPAIQDADFLLDVSLDRAHILPVLAPGAAVDAVSGEAAMEIAIEKRGERLRVPAGKVQLAKLGVGSGGSTVFLDGGVSWDGTALRIRDLGWVLGESRGAFTGLLDLREDAPSGRLGLTLESFDTQDIERQIRAFAQIPAAPPASKPSGPPAGTPQWVHRLAERLSRVAAQVDAEVAVLKVVLPPGIPVRADALTQQLRLKKGPISLSFAGMVDGGFVQGTVETRTDVPDPQLHLAYKADRIRPGPVVDAYLQRTFPGMTASGPLTLIDESHQKLLPGPGDANWPTGKGELIIDSGAVEGRAAPLWMTKIFPGLNLARFDFSYMHSWFTKEATGRIHHQMIYRGRYYNTYMKGYSQDGDFRYEVGIDFLADFNSKYWAESGQGRIPLFIKTGKVQADGTIANEQVDFMPPQRVIDTLLIRNNPVVTAYHAVRKRVLSEK